MRTIWWACVKTKQEIVTSSWVTIATGENTMSLYYLIYRNMNVRKHKCRTCTLESYSIIWGKDVIVPINNKILRSIETFSDQMSEQDQIWALQRASDRRDNHLPGVEFVYTTDVKKAQIKHKFKTWPVAFGRNDLAYVMNRWIYQHDVYYNEWKRDRHIFDIEVVWAHELWHVLWLGHNVNDDLSLMWPAYRPHWKVVADDINWFLSRYGQYAKSERDVESSKKLAVLILRNKSYVSKYVAEKTIIKILDFYKIPHPDARDERKQFFVALLCDYLKI